MRRRLDGAHPMFIGPNRSSITVNGLFISPQSKLLNGVIDRRFPDRLWDLASGSIHYLRKGDL
jgi:hypothetical protein